MFDQIFEMYYNFFFISIVRSVSSEFSTSVAFEIEINRHLAFENSAANFLPILRIVGARQLPARNECTSAHNTAAAIFKDGAVSRTFRARINRVTRSTTH